MKKEKVLHLLKEHLEEIQEFKIQRISIFGSVARDQDTPGSDIDVLVKFKVPATFDLYMDLLFYLEDLLGRKVDLVTEDALRSELKQFVEKDLICVF